MKSVESKLAVLALKFILIPFKHRKAHGISQQLKSFIFLDKKNAKP